MALRDDAGRSSSSELFFLDHIHENILDDVGVPPVSPGCAAAPMSGILSDDEELVSFSSISCAARIFSVLWMNNLSELDASVRISLRATGE